MTYDYLIIGSGLSGATMARLLSDAGKRVLVVEKRDHVGGNVATHVEDGIVLHDYGPHIFHTSYDDVWAFVQRYVTMNPFINSPLANYHGEIYHMPFNMNTFHELWGVTTPEEAKAKIAAEVAQEGIKEPHNLEEQALSLVGRTIYTKLIKGYTEKQWNRDCRDLPASIIKRLPLRFTYDNNYFNDAYQGIPEGGYSVLIDALLRGVEVRTSSDYFAHRPELDRMANHVI
jgi:UDP-galactopyranose mutase